ncbi:hypothetical protein TOPH_09289, partial [Tolypocladium ophioglossoides CBS 100239]
LSEGLKNIQTEATSTKKEVQSLRTAVLDTNQKTVLSRLPVADGASFDSNADEHEATCLEGTRRELLEQVKQWANDSTRLNNRRKEELIEDFQQVIGSIITLAAPLSPASLDRLLQRSTKDVDRLLSFLHSVLNIPPERSAPIRLFYQSFRDYLIDPQGGANEFIINESSTHEMLTANAFSCSQKITI